MPHRHQLHRADWDAVRAIAGRYVGELARVERVPSHHNIVCRLRGTNGRRRVLKLAASGVSQPGLTREPRVVELLSGRGIPTARIDYFDAAGTLVGRPWFIANDAGRRTAADASGLSPANRRELYRAIGRLLAQVHAIPFDRPADFSGGELVPASFESSPLRRWHERQVADADRLGLLRGLDSATLEALLHPGGPENALLPSHAAPGTSLAVAPRPASFSLCHGDYNPSQCVRQGASVSAMIDWESSHVGDPLYDLAAFEVMLRVASPRDLADEAMAGYREVRAFDPTLDAAYLPVRLAHAASLAAAFHRARRTGPARAARLMLGRLATPTTTDAQAA